MLYSCSTGTVLSSPVKQYAYHSTLDVCRKMHNAASSKDKCMHERAASMILLVRHLYTLLEHACIKKTAMLNALRDASLSIKRFCLVRPISGRISTWCIRTYTSNSKLVYDINRTKTHTLPPVAVANLYHMTKLRLHQRLH